MEDDGKLNKDPHYHQEKSQTFFAIKPDKEDKEENVHLKNLTEVSEDINEDQYIDVTKLPNIRSQRKNPTSKPKSAFSAPSQLHHPYTSRPLLPQKPHPE